MRVRELENLGIIKEAHITRKKNCHTVCNICLYLDREDEISQLRKLLGQEICVEDEERIYLRGEITGIDCVTTFSGSYAHIIITSLSKKLDKQKNYRIFQDCKKKYKDVIASFCEGDNNIQITDKDLANKEEPEILVQDGMTDFEFLKMLSNNIGYDLYVVDTERTPNLNICIYSEYTQGNLNEKNTKTYQFKKNEYSEELFIRSTDYLEMGQLTEYQGVQYVVASVKIHYKNGIVQYEYILERKNISISKHRFTGGLGEAKVTDNNDPEKMGRIQVQFSDYEDKMEDNRIWIPYLMNITENSQGSLLIPGKEEIVNVFCKNGKCYSDGCIRSVAYNEWMSNPEDRIVMFKDKIIAVHDDEINLGAFDNKVTINKDSIIISKECNYLKLEKNMTFLQMGDTRIKIDDSSMQIQASESIDLKSNKMNIDGRGSISVKASSFDIG